MKVLRLLMIMLLVLSMMAPVSLDAFSISAPTEDGIVRVSSEYRKIGQGEIIKITLTPPEAASARLSFDGKIFSFVSNGKGVTLFTLLPLRVDMEPGDYDAVIRLEPFCGSSREIPFKLALPRGIFPSTRIHVARRFTSPSPEDLKRMHDDEALLDRIYEKSVPAWLGAGTFVMPLKGPVSGVFGEQRMFNNEVMSRHRGVDIRAPRGAPVKASNAGRVALARNLYFAGNTVILDHGIGLFSMYCHLSKIVVREGTVLDSGTVLGYVGSTGRSTGPHLHWGMRLAGDYVDPLSVLHLSFD